MPTLKGHEAMAVVKTQQVKPQRKSLNIVLWILQLMMAFAFINSGVLKLTGNADMVEMFNMIDIGQWFRYVIGVIEVCGAIGLLIPKLNGLAALGLVTLMTGATITNAFIINVTVVPPLIILAICSVIAWGRWGQAKVLVHSFLPKRT
jgi:putative oxidoreductase